MKKSEKYQLNLPEGSDPYDVEHMNANTRIIEQKLKENEEHNANKNNPHGVTKTQVGLGNVDNTADIDKPVSTAQKAAIDTAIANLINGAPTTLDTLKEISDAMAEHEDVVEALEESIGKKANATELTTHTSNKNNPHGVTKSQVGLGNVDNTADKDKPVSTAQQQAIDNATVSGTAIGTNPTIQDSTNAPIIYGKFKGYTLQDGEPTPDNHIHVDGLGDKGYFDGMLLQGAYNPSTGAYGSANLFLCNKNGIPCKEGDVIRIAYEGEADHVRALFYNDDTFVSQTYSNGNLHTDTVPSGVNVVKFNVYNASGITPSTAKHISVTINGKYAIEVKTIGKNVFSATLEDYQNNGTISGAGTELYFKLKPNTVYTCSSNALKYNDAGDANIWFNGGSSYTHGVNLDNPKTTTTDNDGMLYVALRTSNLEDLFNNYWIQVEEGDTATEYEKPVSSTAAIPTDAPLYEGDYIEVYADGSGRLYKKFMNFNPTTVEIVAENVGAYIKLIKGYCKARSTALCNYLKLDVTGKTTSFTFGSNAEGNFSHCFIKVLGLTTKEEYQSWLNERSDLEVVYELATPTETPLTAAQVAQFKQLYTFEPVTNVLCDGEVEMRYYKANVNGETVGMLQGMVEKSNETVGILQESIRELQEVDEGGTVLSFENDSGEVSGSLSVFHHRLSENTYLLTINATLTKVPENSDDMLDVNLTLQDIGFADNIISDGYSQCILASEYPLIVNGTSYCLGGGTATVSINNKGFYLTFLPFKNIKGSINSATNKALLSGTMFVKTFML